MKKALIVLTNHGLLGETGKSTGWYLPEVTHVYYPLIEAGFNVDFASPKGGVAPMDPSSADRSDLMNKKFLDDAFLVKQTRETLSLDNVDGESYQAVYFAGGHGTMWDFPISDTVSKVGAAVYESGGVVASACHGAAALTNIRLSNGQYLVAGHKVNSFTDQEEKIVKLENVVPFLLEKRLKELGGEFVAGEPWSNTVVVSGRLITGQNPQSAHSVGQSIVNAFEGK